MNRAHVASLGEALARLEFAIDEIAGARCIEPHIRTARLELAGAWRAFAELAQDAGEPPLPRPPRIPS